MRAASPIAAFCVLWAGHALAEPAGRTGAIPDRDRPAKSDVQLDELSANARPKPQADLDTIKLASAQRERAASVEERTNGLWQSWLVSICQGCGADTPPAKAVLTQRAQTASTTREPGRMERRQPPSRGYAGMYADLSTGSLSQIRRMPY